MIYPLLAAASKSIIELEEEAANPFRVLALLIFVLAIIHTLVAHRFAALSERVAARHSEMQNRRGRKRTVSFMAEILHFLGEVEVVFAFWAIPLFFLICFFYNWSTAVNYLNNRLFIEPMFVVVVMSLVSTRPILRLAEGSLWLVAQAFGGSIAAWWLSILTIGPILGAFITEVGAMTICALILMRQFYNYSPGKKLAYGTLGLLFVNISVGGLLTNFASPPVLIVSRAWDWSSSYMFFTFGWKALIGIVAANIVYYLYFRKELHLLEKVKKERGNVDEAHAPIPFWIMVVHIFFLVWMVINSHYPAIFIGAFLLFLGFHQATAHHQESVQLKRPLLVGMFLAGLIIHGGLQGWWIEPILSNLGYESMMFVSMALTPFNDNAAITYLASLIPHLDDTLKYAVVAGVVAGGGLTVIANAPNPAGQALLKKYFKKGISPLYLFFGAFVPTLILYLIFYFL
jgi:Na+/H+ antiporter NhaD/arsenite permease-like protein